MEEDRTPKTEDSLEMLKYFHLFGPMYVYKLTCEIIYLFQEIRFRGAGSGYEVNSSQHRARASSPHCDRYQDAAAASQMLDIINDDYNVTVMLLTRYVSFHERNNAQTSNLAPGG